jgi:hypothetical protein
MEESYPASLRSIGGSTQGPVFLELCTEGHLRSPFTNIAGNSPYEVTVLVRSKTKHTNKNNKKIIKDNVTANLIHVHVDYSYN